MPEPKVRFMKDDGSRYPAWKEYSISDLFTKIGNKNKDGQNTNVITNSAEFGLIPQRDYFDKDIAVEGNTGNYTIIQTGDFVYNPRKSSYAPMGPFNCYRMEEDGIVSPLYSCLRPKGVLNPEYLLWYFQTDKWYGYVNDHGAQNGARHDRVGMTDKILMGIPVTAPCEEEQRKIANFLTSVDEVITASEEEVANLETQKKAVMKKIFSQEVRFKRADGSDFPEWEEKTIGDVTDSLTGYAFESELFTEKGIRLLRGMNIKRGDLDFSEDICKYWPTSEGLEKFLLQENDLIVQMDGALVGKSFGLVKAEHLPALLVQRVTRLRGDSTIIQLLYQILSTGEFDKDMKLNQTSTAVPHISLKDITGYGICIPSDPEEQRLIADFLSNFDEAIVAAKKELELWKELKKGLLQQMFV